jgi:hypothetical protein
MDKQISNALHSILFISVIGFSLLFYIIIHEAGHAIVAVLCGSVIDEFAIINIRPHISYSGNAVSTLSRFVNIAGPIFPVMVNIVLLTFIPISKYFLLEAFKTCFTLITAFSLTGTAIATLLYMLGRTTDIDTIGFYSMNPGVSPLAMMFIWICIFFLLILMMIKRANYRIMPGFSLIPFRAEPLQGHLVRIVFMSLVLMTTISIAAVWYFRKGKPAVIYSIDLSTFTAGEVELYQFNVIQDSATFSISIRGLDAEEFELSVKTDTVKSILLSGKGIIADNYDRPFVLKKGIHSLTAHNMNGNGILLVNQNGRY